MNSVRWYFIAVFVIVTVIFLRDSFDRYRYYRQIPQIRTTIPIHSGGVKAKVVSVSDGDTIKIDTGETVRYLGIDTPELHHPRKPVQCYGREARLMNEALVAGRVVWLESDRENTDHYGRILRYVFVTDPYNPKRLIFVNQALLQEGFAHKLNIAPNSLYADAFDRLESLAQRFKKGLWRDCPAGN